MTHRPEPLNVDELHLAVGRGHFAEDCRTVAAIVMTRPHVPPSLIRRLANHRSMPGCPLSRVAESYREADAALADRSRS
jgi:hypothetical protein